MKKAALAALVALTSPGLMAAAPLRKPTGTIVVNSTADAHDASAGDGVCETATGNGTCTLRAAIEEAGVFPGTDITFSSSLPNPTTILLDLGPLFIKRNLTITGNGVSSTLIDAGGLHQAFYLSGGTVAISALTIRNGVSASDGGGIFSDVGTDLRLSNVALVNNSAGTHNGGGIASYGSATLDHCEVTGNAAALGAGIYGDGGDLTVTSSAIHDNSVGSTSNGAGLWLQQTSATLRDSTVAFNGGGGIFLFGSDSLDVIDSTITGNTVSNYAGGGILVQNFSNLHAYNATITGNICGIGYIGGGIFWIQRPPPPSRIPFLRRTSTSRPGIRLRPTTAAVSWDLSTTT